MVQATAETTLAGTERCWRTFERLIEPAAGGIPPGCSASESGAGAICRGGISDHGDEDWRFTNVAPVTKLPFRPVLEPREAGAELPADLVFGDWRRFGWSL
jgi:hypothetical protein